MTISLRPSHLRRYKDIVRLLARYGRDAMVSASELEDLGAEMGPERAAAGGEELAADLEALGPTFIKLGQVLSTRADLLPLPYLEALARLQDNVEPFPFADVQRTVESDLGVRLSKAFSAFESEPLAAASLGQVYRAALRDGRVVAVKVQRPEIRETIAADLAAFGEIAEFLDAHTAIGRHNRFAGIVLEFRRSLIRELDYQLEAQHLIALGKSLELFDRLVVPQPVADYTSSRVLTMDYVRGRKITAVGPLTRLELDGAALAEELFRAYLHQILVDGFFHADPHPGNVFLTEDRRLALLDLGMVGWVSPGLQDQLLKLVLAVSEGQGEEAARIAETVSEKRPDFDPARFQHAIAALVSETRGAAIRDLALGRQVLRLARVAAEGGVRLPSELTLLGKTLLQLDRLGRFLDPTFEPNAALRRHLAELTSTRMWRSASPSSLLAAFHELREFVEHLPARANKILDKVANNELSFRVDTIDERSLLAGAQKVANRITLGLVLAALIVGAALLMRIDTTFRLFGYPGLAILLFVAAAAGACGLVVSILGSDVRGRGHGRSP